MFDSLRGAVSDLSPHAVVGVRHDALPAVPLSAVPCRMEVFPAPPSPELASISGLFKAGLTFPLGLDVAVADRGVVRELCASLDSAVDQGTIMLGGATAQHPLGELLAPRQHDKGRRTLRALARCGWAF